MKNRLIEIQNSLVFDTTFYYGVILKIDLLKKVGINLKYSTGKGEWHGNEISMQHPKLKDHTNYEVILYDYIVHIEDSFLMESLGDICI